MIVKNRLFHAAFSTILLLECYIYIGKGTLTQGVFSDYV